MNERKPKTAVPPIPPERWVLERPHDSAEYLKRRGPWPKPPQAKRERAEADQLLDPLEHDRRLDS